MEENILEKVVALAKRRGFIYPSSEIYGGLANTWDFGYFGTLLKYNLRDLWFEDFVLKRDDMVALDTSIFLNPKVWEASGHVESFTDALIDCKNCKFRTRADHLIEENKKNIKVEGLSPKELTKIIKDSKIKCPNCGSFDFTDVRKFNLLFETHVGIVEESKSKVYLRGELAQGIFVNFKNVIDTMRVKIPFGIASVGKVFRNEITMGQSVFRTLEFDLMELEYFINPKDWEKIYDLWKDEMWSFAVKIGLNESNLKWREHEIFERSHYSKKTMDLEYNYPFGWKEMWGLAYRTDYDLKNHAKNSGKDLKYRDQEIGKEYFPHVIEPTFGLSRLALTVLLDSYKEDEKRVYLKLNPRIAPVKVAVFPLLANKEQLVRKAKEVYDDLKKSIKGLVVFDDRGNIGKRYLSQDEIGTPYCITIDFQTLEDGAVTIRDRDTTVQERIRIEELDKYFLERF